MNLLRRLQSHSVENFARELDERIASYDRGKNFEPIIKQRREQVLYPFEDYLWETLLVKKKHIGRVVKHANMGNVLIKSVTWNAEAAKLILYYVEPYYFDPEGIFANQLMGMEHSYSDEDFERYVAKKCPNIEEIKNGVDWIYDVRKSDGEIVKVSESELKL